MRTPPDCKSYCRDVASDEGSASHLFITLSRKRVRIAEVLPLVRNRKGSANGFLGEQVHNCRSVAPGEGSESKFPLSAC